MMLSRIFTTSAGFLALLGFAGCGSTPQIECSSTATTCTLQRFIAATTNAGEVLLFPVQQNGTLGAGMAVSPGPQGAAAGIAVSNPSREVFVADHAGEALFAYVSSGSSYSSAPGSPYLLGSSEGLLEGVTATSDGKFVYVVGLNGGVFGFSIGSNGALSPIPGSPFPVAAGNSVASVADNFNKFLFVISGSSISPLVIDASTGALSAPAPPFSFGVTNLATFGMAAITANNFLYVALSNSNGVGAFSFDASTGALTPVSGSPFAAGKTPLNVTASSNALYVSNSGDQTISAFSWDSSTGGLIPVSGSPFNAQFTNELTVLGDQYLYTPSINNVFPPTTNAILGFAVGGSGSLTPIKGSPFQSRTQLSGGVAAF